MWGTGLARRAVMSAIPTTTAPGPDQARLRDLMRRLAEIESTEAAVLSVYLDVRPEAHAERPAERPQLIEVRERLDSVGRAYEPQTPAAESFAADRARIDELVRGEDLAGVEGVAAFACDAIGLWEVVRAQTPFETHVAVGPTAELFQLAKLLDDQISAVVAVLNTSTCRLFATRRGGLFERSGLDEPSDEHKRHDQGGWSQARFQRHVDMQDKRFAKEAAEAVERVIPVLERELPEAVRALVAHVTHLGVRAGTTEVNDEVAPLLSALEEADDGEVADRAIGAMRAGGLGVAGIDDTMRALEVGQVDELVIDESVEMDEELRAELIRQASLTDARVTVTREHPGLARYEGVAATLRFRI
jgi:peptide chain release factor subunit 1